MRHFHVVVYLTIVYLGGMTLNISVGMTNNIGGIIMWLNIVFIMTYLGETLLKEAQQKDIVCVWFCSLLQVCR